MKKVITHSSRFHPDDVFSVATLAIFFKDQIEVIRTRDPEVIEKGDIVLDVGNIYDPKISRFDHHQKEGAGLRENNIPYASFGLIWKHFGKDLCSSEEVWKSIDIKLVQPIDAGDNGISVYDLNEYNVNPYLLHNIVFSYFPTWKEEKNFDKHFLEAVDFAKDLINKEIKLAEHYDEAKNIIIERYKESQKNKDENQDKRLIIFENDDFDDGTITRALDDYKDILYFIVKTSDEETWKVKCLRKEMNSFKNRKDLPKEWAGLRDEELQKVTGVKDAVFCHRGLFMAVAKSKEGVMEMAKKALDN